MGVRSWETGGGNFSENPIRGHSACICVKYIFSSLRTPNSHLSLTLNVRPLLLTFGMLIACIALHGQGQTRTTKQMARNYYVNGNLKSVSETWTTIPRYIDPMNFYKKTKVYVMEYDSLSKQKVK